jgi:hypothetical protein
MTRLWLHTFGEAVGLRSSVASLCWEQGSLTSAGTVFAVCKQADSLPNKSDSAIISGTLTSREQSSAAAFRACFACIGRLPYLTIIISAT